MKSAHFFPPATTSQQGLHHNRAYSDAAGASVRPGLALLRPMFALAALLAVAVPAHATDCVAAFNNGSAQLLCTEPGKANSQCDFGLEVKLEGGSTSVLNGKFTVSKGAKNQLVFQATQAGGKRIVGVGKASTKICSPTK